MSRLPVTLQDIAVRTGVSKVTVSYVLNGRETQVRISDSTRQRVLSVAREMGYTPNAVARALARRRTDTLTLVMQSPRVFSGGSAFISEMMHGVLDAANALDYDVLIHTKNLPDVDAEVGALTDGRADGLLVLRDRDDPLLAQLQAREFPHVSLFARLDGPEARFVDCDNVQGARQAVEFLWQLGHRRIGWIGGNPASAAVHDRYQGYTEALAQHGLCSNPAHECQVTFQKGDFTPLVTLIQKPNAPTAFFVWSDDVAIGAIAALRTERGLRVPDDVSIIGFDGTDRCEQTVPRLTTVRQPIYDIATLAVRQLVQQIRRNASSDNTEDAVAVPSQILLSPTLVQRDSCAPPPPLSSLGTVNAALPTTAVPERTQ